MFETKTGVVIGSKFTGSQEVRNTIDGVYFAVMPTIESSMEKLQAQILEWSSQEHKRVRQAIKEGGYTDMPYRPWPTLEHQDRWSRFSAVRKEA